jgi:serine/threonine protein kinase
MTTPANHRREITLLQERSAGTFARVYLARATDSGGLSRIVAVKMLKERWTDSEDVINRTRDEAQLLASLQHQNIVRVEAITEIDACPAIIMEFVHGVDLSELIKAIASRRTAIPARTVFEIAEGIASALAAAWFKVPIGRSEPLRVVHRDIKPSNIMISTEGELRVLDFGTARFEDASRRAKTEAFRFGSLKYMSPERRDGDRGQHPADLYSLGLLIIELLGGRIEKTLPIVPQAHNAAVIRLIDAIPSFGLPNTGWDASLRETLTRLCAADPDARLDARQTVKLMRAFKQQATGDGLIAFAEDVVAPLTEAINAIPEFGPAESAKATRFEIDSHGRTSVLQRAPIADELPTQLAVPSVSIGVANSDALAPEDAPTQADMSKATPFSGAQDIQQTTMPSSWNPNVKSRPTQTGPQATPGNAQRLPPAQPAQDKRTSKQYIGIGCAIASVVLLIMAGIGGVSWMLFLKKTEQAYIQTNPISVDTTPSTPAGTPAGAEKSDGRVSIALHGGDPTVQWLRLSNADGVLLLTARPSDSADLAPGKYTLSVKVVARTALSGTLDLEVPLDLTCQPTTRGRIRCLDARGKTQLLLQP